MRLTVSARESEDAAFLDDDICSGDIFPIFPKGPRLGSRGGAKIVVLLNCCLRVEAEVEFGVAAGLVRGEPLCGGRSFGLPSG